MRMFWLCGTFVSPTSIGPGGCHCCLCFAPIQAFELAHCWGFSHFSWQEAFLWSSKVQTVFWKARIAEVFKKKSA